MISSSSFGLKFLPEGILQLIAKHFFSSSVLHKINYLRFGKKIDVMNRFFSILILLICFTLTLTGQKERILLEGLFHDWDNRTYEYTDPDGDGRPDTAHGCRPSL